MNLKEEDEKKIIEDLDLAEEDIILVELPKGKDNWTFVSENEDN